VSRVRDSGDGDTANAKPFRILSRQAGGDYRITLAKPAKFAKARSCCTVIYFIHQKSIYTVLPYIKRHSEFSQGEIFPPAPPFRHTQPAPAPCPRLHHPLVLLKQACIHRYCSFYRGSCRATIYETTQLDAVLCRASPAPPFRNTQPAPASCPRFRSPPGRYSAARHRRADGHFAGTGPLSLPDLSLLN